MIRNLRKKLSRKTIDIDMKEQYSTLLDACLQKHNPTKQDGLGSCARFDKRGFG